jgi:hypothetical protein
VASWPGCNNSIRSLSLPAAATACDRTEVAQSCLGRPGLRSPHGRLEFTVPGINTELLNAESCAATAALPNSRSCCSRSETLNLWQLARCNTVWLLILLKYDEGIPIMRRRQRAWKPSSRLRSTAPNHVHTTASWQHMPGRSVSSSAALLLCVPTLAVEL